MKDRETQLAFIKARAEGKSYSSIAQELGIAKATCTSWERSFRADIEAMKQAHLEELYTAYSMKREARIKKLGSIIQGLDKAIAEKPLADLSIDKLLELRLKYGRELKEEYREPVELPEENTLDGLLEQYNQLYTESRSGSYTPAEVKAQLSILEAKKETMFNLAGEQRKEEEDLLSLDFMNGYTSKIIRHEDQPEE